MSTIGDRLKEIRSEKGVSQKDFGEKFGIPQATYARYEIDKSSIPDSLMQQLARMGVNLHWLITGTGPKYSDDSISNYSPHPVTTGVLISRSGRVESIELRTGEILVPILQQRLSAGAGQEWLPDDFTDERLPLLARFIKPYKKEDVFAAHVSGDSMIDIQLNDGDIAFFAKCNLDGDGIYAIAVDGEIFIKRVEVDPFARMLIIRSENELYEPKVVEPDRVVSLGKVIGWIHRL